MGSSVAAAHGILVKGADIFEKAAGVTAVLFDKTGRHHGQARRPRGAMVGPAERGGAARLVGPPSAARSN